MATYLSWDARQKASKSIRLSSVTIASVSNSSRRS